MICRRLDANADGDFADAGDRTFYHLTDAQFSTVAILDENAKLIERVAYDAYGRPLRQDFTDVDGVGIYDVQGAMAALDQEIGAAGGSPLIGDSEHYFADHDIDRDGDVDEDDMWALEQGGMDAPFGALSADNVRNIFGFSGYIYNAELITSGDIGTGACGGVYTIRFRHYDTALGRWLQRDPLEYVDGMSMYQYVTGSPLGALDPFGLCGEGGGLGDDAGGKDNREPESSPITIAPEPPQPGVIDPGEDRSPVVIGPEDFLRERARNARETGELIEALLDWEMAILKEIATWMVPGGLIVKIGGKIIRIEKLANGTVRYIRVPCFVGGTLIATANGPVAIEDIEVGDLVWSWSEETGEIALREVTAVSVTAGASVLTLTLLSPDGDCDSITCTPSHRFWVADQGWMRAEELQPGWCLAMADGACGVVIRIDRQSGQEVVYNLEVEEFHSYFVGDGQFCAHNGADDCLAQITVEGRALKHADDARKMIERNGFRFSETYYQKLWNTGRKAPSLIAREILEGAGGAGVPDAMPGFYRYVHGGWEMIYNPVTREVWHIQPIH